jgi:hypothetical protein
MLGGRRAGGGCQVAGEVVPVLEDPVGRLPGGWSCWCVAMTTPCQLMHTRWAAQSGAHALVVLVALHVVCQVL